MPKKITNEDKIMKRILKSKQEYKKQIFNEFKQIIDNIGENVLLETPEDKLTARLIIAYLKDALKELYNSDT